MLDYLLLILAWVLFGAIHSLTAARSVKQRLMGASLWLPRYYRLIYNGLALLTFLPVWLAYQSTPRVDISAWKGSELLGDVLIGAGTILGLIALVGYDLVEFTGFPPRQPVKTTDTLRQQGLLRYVRHPLYSGMLICLLGIFLRAPTWVNLIFGGFGFLYIRIGIYFEEQKLLADFGQSYREYKSKVPMLVPFLKGR